MISKLINSELEYIRNFSQSFENEKVIRFWDNGLSDMYMHNFTYLKSNANTNDLNSLILSEIEQRKKNGNDFLRIEANFTIEDKTIKELPITPEVSKYDFMCIETGKYKLLSGNTNCIIKEAITPQILRDGIEVDILANEAIMGNDFAQRRIHRKSEIYKLADSNLSLYVCYHNDTPIGNCELMISNKIAKIEDFDILEKYQRKGFGTSVLKHLLKHAKDSSVEIAYLITDSSDTAKEMYKKNCFYKAGEKTEFFFNFK